MVDLLMVTFEDYSVVGIMGKLYKRRLRKKQGIMRTREEGRGRWVVG